MRCISNDELVSISGGDGEQTRAPNPTVGNPPLTGWVPPTTATTSATGIPPMVSGDPSIIGAYYNSPQNGIGNRPPYGA